MAKVPALCDASSCKEARKAVWNGPLTGTQLLVSLCMSAFLKAVEWSRLFWAMDQAGSHPVIGGGGGGGGGGNRDRVWLYPKTVADPPPFGMPFLSFPMYTHCVYQLCVDGEVSHST